MRAVRFLSATRNRGRLRLAIAKRVVAFIFVTGLSQGAFAPPAFSFDNDANVLNWATIADPGPQPPMNLDALSAYAYDTDRPRGAIDGVAQVHFKDGSAFGCQNRAEWLYFIPETPYTLWLLRTTASQSRADTKIHWWWLAPGVPQILGRTAPTVVRAIPCADSASSGGYFKIVRVPTGKYLIVADIDRFQVSGGYEEHYNYQPGAGGGWYGTQSGSLGMQIKDEYFLVSSVDVASGDRVYRAAPFTVVAHMK